MIVVPTYREHRIDVTALAAGEGRWHAAVSLRRTLSNEKPHRVEPGGKRSLIELLIKRRQRDRRHRAPGP